jgi:hypothetical protein
MRTTNYNALLALLDVAFNLPFGSYVIQHVHCSLSCTVGSSLQELTLSERQQSMVNGQWSSDAPREIKHTLNAV